MTMHFSAPYPGDGFVHANVPGRAIARCGLPDSQDWTVCSLETAEDFLTYPAGDRCVTCGEMVAAGEDGPREWSG